MVPAKISFAEYNPISRVFRNTQLSFLTRESHLDIKNEVRIIHTSFVSNSDRIVDIFFF
jgi:hypothetical protein